MTSLHYGGSSSSKPTTTRRHPIRRSAFTFRNYSIRRWRLTTFVRQTCTTFRPEFVWSLWLHCYFTIRRRRPCSHHHHQQMSNVHAAEETAQVHKYIIQRGYSRALAPVLSLGINGLTGLSCFESFVASMYSQLSGARERFYSGRMFSPQTTRATYFSKWLLT